MHVQVVLSAYREFLTKFDSDSFQVVLACMVCHYPHKTHLVAGFMGEPTGQLKAVANSALLDTLPLTLHAC